MHDAFRLEDKYFTSDNEHDMAQHIEKPARGIPNQVKNIIREIFDSGLTKPLQINAELVRRGFAEERHNCLTSFLQVLRKEKFGNEIQYMNQLEIWASEHQVAENQHTPFVIASDFSYEEKNFCIFISTPILLTNCSKAKIVQADSTFKLNWCGFPVILVGTSDQSRVIK